MELNIEGLTPNLLSTIDIPLTPKQAKLYLKKNKLKENATIKVPSTSIQYLLPIFFLLTLVIILSTFFFLK